VNVTGVNVTSPSAITITGSVDPLAFVGTRNITVTTGSQVQVLSNAFSVSAGPAAIALLNPNSGNQGQTLSIAITGSNTHFAQNTTTASFGQGISVNSLMVNSPISAIASITIAANATPQLNLVTLTTLGEITTPAAFNVTGRTKINAGLEAVIAAMLPGERRVAIVPAPLAYGRAGLYSPEIPGKRRFVISPNAMLVYEIEVLKEPVKDK
jgi:hypothetical protein